MSQRTQVPRPTWTLPDASPSASGFKKTVRNGASRDAANALDLSRLCLISLMKGTASHPPPHARAPRTLGDGDCGDSDRERARQSGQKARDGGDGKRKRKGKGKGKGRSKAKGRGGSKAKLSDADEAAAAALRAEVRLSPDPPGLLSGMSRVMARFWGFAGDDGDLRCCGCHRVCRRRPLSLFGGGPISSAAVATGRPMKCPQHAQHAPSPPSPHPP